MSIISTDSNNYFSFSSSLFIIWDIISLKSFLIKPQDGHYDDYFTTFLKAAKFYIFLKLNFPEEDVFLVTFLVILVALEA